MESCRARGGPSITACHAPMGSALLFSFYSRETKEPFLFFCFSCPLNVISFVMFVFPCLFPQAFLLLPKHRGTCYLLASRCDKLVMGSCGCAAGLSPPGGQGFMHVISLMLTKAKDMLVLK